MVPMNRVEDIEKPNVVLSLLCFTFDGFDDVRQTSGGAHVRFRYVRSFYRADLAGAHRFGRWSRDGVVDIGFR